jgi:endonuclease/exonuclease/phosphatase family metal-dependent hydrolase
MNRLLLLALLFSMTCACSPAPADDALPDLEAAKFDASAGVGFCIDAGTPEETGVLQLVNDPALSAVDLQQDLDRSAAEAVVAARPIATLGALDALPSVGKTACRSLRERACTREDRCHSGLAVMTWNINLFPHSDHADEVIVSQLTRLAPDVVGFEEILDPNAFQAMAQLAGYRVVLAERGYDSGVGALVRDSVTVLASESLYLKNSYAFPRPPLRLSLQLSSGQRLDLIVVHLKAQLDAASQTRRRAAVSKLAADLASATIPTVIIGDWNDQITDAPAENIFGPLVQQGYTFLTMPLAQAGKYSYPPFHSFLDHVALDGNAVQQLHPFVTDVLPLDQQVSRYQDTVSDHDPVVSRFAPH